MSGSTVTHAELVERAAYWLRNSMRCGVVLTERQAGAEIPDAIGWGKHVIVVECKVSRADFFADAQKPHRASGMGELRFFLTPPALVGFREVPDGWGLLYANARVITRVWQARPRTDDRDRERELRLVLGELRRYQLHGITYPPVMLNGKACMAGRVPGLPTRQFPEVRA